MDAKRSVMNMKKGNKMGWHKILPKLTTVPPHCCYTKMVWEGQLIMWTWFVETKLPHVKVEKLCKMWGQMQEYVPRNQC